jgi:hypothetical protein
MRYGVLGGIGIILLLAVWMIVQLSLSPERPAVQTGPIQIEGVVTSTGISLIRRGTHVLSVRGQALYYLESSKLNLDDFEDHMVTASGTVELNVSDEYLPVLVVDSIESSDEPSRGEQTFASLGIAMTVPEGWNVNIEKGILTARLSGSTVPFLTMRQDPSGVLAESGQTLRIGGRSASRITRPDGSAEILVSMNPGVLRLQVIPSEEDKPLIVETLDSALRSLRFLAASPRSSSSRSTGSGGTLPTVCGGVAGILCPSGFYCEITDHTVNTGRCRSM